VALIVREPPEKLTVVSPFGPPPSSLAPIDPDSPCGEVNVIAVAASELTTLHVRGETHVTVV
jgi:hypothetical protein